MAAVRLQALDSAIQERRSSSTSSHGFAQQVTCKMAFVPMGCCLQRLDRIGGWKHEQFNLAAFRFALYVVHDGQRACSSADD
jgi:hypothetical protein